MEDTINIKPVAGRSLPVEGDFGKRVTKPMTVKNTAYYRRAIRRGDIDPATAKKPSVKKDN